eukprot:scaffold181769_cov15-Tisochrysis_lutea.AAC.1
MCGLEVLILTAPAKRARPFSLLTVHSTPLLKHAFARPPPGPHPAAAPAGGCCASLYHQVLIRARGWPGWASQA